MTAAAVRAGTDLAAKAVRKLAGPHAPASLTKLEQAIKRAHNAHTKAERADHDLQQAARERGGVRGAGASPVPTRCTPDMTNDSGVQVPCGG